MIANGDICAARATATLSRRVRCRVDLAYAPVRALERVICLIKDSVFFPDATRANFFSSGTNPLVPGTPMPCAFQPRNPVLVTQNVDQGVVDAPEQAMKEGADLATKHATMFTRNLGFRQPR